VTVPGSRAPRRVYDLVAFPLVFRYLLVLPDGAPTLPVAVLVTAVPHWKVDEVCMTGSGDRYRILAIDTEVHEELAERGINGMFVVEPVRD
jgi:hypothetical protein